MVIINIFHKLIISIGEGEGGGRVGGRGGEVGGRGGGGGGFVCRIYRTTNCSYNFIA